MRRCVLFLLLLLAPGVGAAQEHAPSLLQEAGPRNDISIPFGFYNDLFGVAGGYTWARDGFLQQQSNLIVSGMAGTAGSGMLYLKSRNLLVPGFDRLFADPELILAYFHGNYLYADGNPRYTSQRAGTNGSAAGNYISGDGWDNFLQVTFRYLLPIGWGRDHVIDDYHLDRGLLVSGASGGTSPNPLSSGKTFLVARPFYASQTLHSSGRTDSQRTNGADVMLNWDNRDFFTNPSVGQSLTLRWQAGDKAGEHDIYFGDSPEAVANATPDTPGIYRGRQAHLLHVRRLDGRIDRPGLGDVQHHEVGAAGLVGLHPQRVGVRLALLQRVADLPEV